MARGLAVVTILGLLASPRPGPRPRLGVGKHPLIPGAPGGLVPRLAAPEAPARLRTAPGPVTRGPAPVARLLLPGQGDGHPVASLVHLAVLGLELDCLLLLYGDLDYVPGQQNS